MEKCPTEQEIIKSVMMMKQLGMTLLNIRQFVESKGYVSRNGKPFGISSIHAML